MVVVITRTRLGPVDTNDNLSTASEITAMAGQLAIKEKAVEEVTKEVESEEEFQQVDMGGDEKGEGEWILVEGMDDAINYNQKYMDKLIDELRNPVTEVKAVSAPGYTEENIDKLLDLGTCESTSSSATGDNDFKVSKAEWEDTQKTIKSLTASQVETKKLSYCNQGGTEQAKATDIEPP